MKKFIYTAMSFAPMLALAQVTGGPTAGSVGSAVGGLGTQILTIINSTVVPILFAVAVVYFLYGLVKFIMGAGDEEKVKEGKGIMIWGVIGLLVMISIYGILGFLASNLGLTGTGTVTLPKVPTN